MHKARKVPPTSENNRPANLYPLAKNSSIMSYTTSHTGIMIQFPIHNNGLLL